MSRSRPQLPPRRVFNLTTSPSDPTQGPFLQLDQSDILPFAADAAAVVSAADATVTIGGSSTIEASQDVTLQSQATSGAAITTSALDSGVTFGSSTPTASVMVAGGSQGASITAGAAFDMQADANNTLAVTALVPAGGDLSNVTFAYGLGRSTSTAEIQTGAQVVAGTASIQANNANSFSTQTIAGGYNQGGGPGLELPSPSATTSPRPWPRWAGR